MGCESLGMGCESLGVGRSGEASWRRGGCCARGPLRLKCGFSSVKWKRLWQHLTYQELTEVSPHPATPHPFDRYSGRRGAHGDRVGP